MDYMEKGDLKKELKCSVYHIITFMKFTQVYL